jgi:starch phosphorylase
MKVVAEESKSDRLLRSSIGQPAIHPFVPREVPDGLEPLVELALDLRWTWSHGADRLWRSIDERLWKLTANPWFILQSISQRRLDEIAANSAIKADISRLARERAEYLQRSTWYGQRDGARAPACIAYFSMEFGVGEGLPLYAGGLGVLAGDFLKTASDMGVPLIGVGLLFSEGYFRQVLDADGRQLEAYPHNDPAMLPILPVGDSDGGWLRVELELPGRALSLRVSWTQVGRVPLYLLDSNDPVNSAADRGITCKLYDAEPERRLIQEMVLGIAGWRVLEALGAKVDVCHLNEGHPAFASLERARCSARHSGRTFDEALWVTRAGNTFTTHTPVAAGFDRFAPELVVRYLSGYADDLQISVDDLLAPGRANPNDMGEPFNLAFLAMRTSASVNGVSRLHGEVSRGIIQSLFPRWPRTEVPVACLTNGVHAPSWDSAAADQLWTECCGKSRWLTAEEDLCEAVCRASDQNLWELRTENAVHWCGMRASAWNVSSPSAGPTLRRLTERNMCWMREP